MCIARFRKAAALREGPGRVAAIAAWVQSLFSDKESRPVLVGGAAVELYTGGAYRTGDLDFVGTPGPEVVNLLESAGFQRLGRHWVNEQHKVFLEFPGEALGELESTAVIRVGAHSVLIVSLEDLIVDRLAAWRFWKSDIDAINAYLLARAQGVELDEVRLRRLAENADVERALDQLDGFLARHEDTEPNQSELEEWSRSALEGGR